MVDDRAADPVQVVRDLLADGPLAPADFKRLAHQAGVTVKQLPKATRAAGAECVRTGRPGKGAWVWQLRGGVDRFITTKPNRTGYFSDNIWLRGKELQIKLGNDLDTARARVAELLKERDAEREKDKEARRKAPTPQVPRTLPTPKPAPPPPLHVQLRDLARQLIRVAQRLETKESPSCDRR